MVSPSAWHYSTAKKLIKELGKNWGHKSEDGISTTIAQKLPDNRTGHEVTFFHEDAKGRRKYFAEIAANHGFKVVIKPNGKIDECSGKFGFENIKDAAEFVSLVDLVSKHLKEGSKSG